jgi:uncharacterized linocin/CFP29 family protein
MNLGRDKLDWSTDTWKLIDKAVHDEPQRTRIAMKFIPIFMTTSDAKTVPSDTIDIGDPTTLTVDEGLETTIFEISVGFALTKQQVSEMDVSTAVTLATRATNILMQAEDTLIFQGDAALPDKNGQGGNVLFRSGRVFHRNNSFGAGLLGAIDPKNKTQNVEVEPTFVDPNDPTQNRYGENTFGAVAKAYSNLQAQGHYGPYALVLHTDVYADTYAPLATTLILTADRIKPIVTTGSYGTGMLPPPIGAQLDMHDVPRTYIYGTGTLPPFTGLLMSLGGNTMDLAVGMDATTAYLQPDNKRLDQFSVFERFTLRLKDKTALVKLNFLQTAGSTAVTSTS